MVAALVVAIAGFGPGYGLVVLAALVNVAGLIVAVLLACAGRRPRAASHRQPRV